jgi:hypothetical protein
MSRLYDTDRTAHSLWCVVVCVGPELALGVYFDKKQDCRMGQANGGVIS